MAKQEVLTNPTGEHIGVAPHPTRNLLLVAGFFFGGGVMGLFYWQMEKANTAAIAELQDFRQAMATQCKQEQFARPAPAQLNGLYADSSRMQAVVHEQLNNLQHGQPDCERIIKSIKSVDFPVE